MRERSNHYSSILVTLHWLTVILIIGVYSCIELHHQFPRTSPWHERLEHWHFYFGCSIWLVTLVRLGSRLKQTAPEINPPIPAWQKGLSKIVHGALYAMMLVLPVLGLLMLNAYGKTIEFGSLALPHLIGLDKDLGHQIHEVHTFIGNLGYWIIGLHAVAALFHHYVQKDNTLQRMSWSKK